jgi:hypothetical protein
MPGNFGNISVRTRLFCIEYSQKVPDESLTLITESRAKKCWALFRSTQLFMNAILK